MKRILYKTFTWILLTIAASIVTVFVQGVINSPSLTSDAFSTKTHFSFEQITETYENGMYESNYVLRLISPDKEVTEVLLFTYPGAHCSEPALIPGTGDITAPHFGYEWRYTSTCVTEQPLGDTVVFGII